MATIDDPVAGWHTEHAYFGRLLDLLQNELELSRRGRRASYEVMLDIVGYLHVYGDRYHHAREEAAFSFIAFPSPRPEADPRSARPGAHGARMRGSRRHWLLTWSCETTNGLPESPRPLPFASAPSARRPRA